MHVYTCIYIYICIERERQGERCSTKRQARARMQATTQTYRQACMQRCKHTVWSTCVTKGRLARECKQPCKHTGKHACKDANTQSGRHASKRQARARMQANMQTYRHTYMRTCKLRTRVRREFPGQCIKQARMMHRYLFNARNTSPRAAAPLGPSVFHRELSHQVQMLPATVSPPFHPTRSILHCFTHPPS